ncbi:alpha/beta hydrolase [Gordonia sp. ABSL11-1]|uniref:alpha/beta fold hydrolase n=1 Tax=Gordonia sp. ABSL11-1 TaxID=3053924 RepID=UPI0025744C38|nr:alpha/beta fold hydrolase [Gordonia sp. ABSL11-1]MDL9948938.1 alpha/beta hydrolase [Gordonia sp. ABSL11-1]
MSRDPRAVLICGVAVDPPVWDETATVLSRLGFAVHVPVRPQSGDLDTEIEALAPLCAGALVIGVSGGATLGLELAARGVPMSAAILHEPAAGALAPGLLDDVVAGFHADGVTGFGHALYGPEWHPDMTAADAATVGRELAMFRAFEPHPPAIGPTSVTLTVGERSPRARHASVQALSALTGIRYRVLPDTGHAPHLQNAFTPLLDDGRLVESGDVTYARSNPR